jgi:hypothetical protein
MAQNFQLKQDHYTMKKQASYFPFFPCIFLFCAMFFHTSSALAQEKKQIRKTENLQTTQISNSGNLVITFNAPVEVANLLVLLVDDKGNTIFLDNQYRFKGPYRHVIDLKPFVSAHYQLQVRNDEDYTERLITMQ